MLLPFASTGAAGPSLGIGLTVIPINDGTNANLSFNNQLWFGIEQGKSFSRQFEVSSASAIAQRLNFSLFDVMYENGARSIRTDRTSQTSQWVTFTPNNVVIPPRGSVVVTMKYSIPQDVQDASYEAYLRVNAFAADAPTAKNGGGGVQVVLAGAAAIDTPVWLGVGDPTTLVSDFEIKEVFGALIDGVKKLRVIIKNSGKTPLGLDGYVQLTDPTFTDRTFGPFNYRTAELKPGKDLAVDIEMPDDVTEGSWKIFVVAEQGNIRKTKVFEEDLTFKPLESAVLIQITILIFALLGFFFGWKLLRKPKEMSVERPVKKAAVKKAVAKKAAVKKAVAKKAPVKKAVAKKAPVKKAPAKKRT